MTISKSLSHLLYHIKEPIVCSACAEAVEAGQTDAKSLQEFIKIDVGFTDQGLQIWCRRHDRNICHIDFAEQMPEADFRCLIPKSS